MQESVISDCLLITLPKFHHNNGDITSINSTADIDFFVKRVYYLYDVPSTADRGAHAHKSLNQLIVAATGSFCIQLFDGFDRVEFTLNRPDQGLLIRPGIWRDINDFSGGCVCLVLASHEYDESDYIRDYNSFLNYKQ
jgi:hypothetical protein